MKISTDLLDVNVWLALIAEDHVHHARALRYWHSEAAERIAFCRLTFLALLRLATNPAAMAGRPFSAPEVWRLARGFRTDSGVIMLPEPAGFEIHLAALSDHAGFPSRRWTDCAIAAWALASGSRLVSFDDDHREFAGVDLLHLSP